MKWFYAVALLFLASVASATLVNPWTRKGSGCQCHHDPTSFECACCVDGACQCGPLGKNLCARCGYVSPITCATQQAAPSYSNGWTAKMECLCPNGKSSDCACCTPGGCRCRNNPYTCTQCGRDDVCRRRRLGSVSRSRTSSGRRSNPGDQFDDYVVEQQPRGDSDNYLPGWGDAQTNEDEDHDSDGYGGYGEWQTQGSGGDYGQIPGGGDQGQGQTTGGADGDNGQTTGGGGQTPGGGDQGQGQTTGGGDVDYEQTTGGGGQTPGGGDQGESESSESTEDLDGDNGSKPNCGGQTSTEVDWSYSYDYDSEGTDPTPSGGGCGGGTSTATPTQKPKTTTIGTPTSTYSFINENGNKCFCQGQPPATTPTPTTTTTTTTTPKPTTTTTTTLATTTTTTTTTTSPVPTGPVWIDRSNGDCAVLAQNGVANGIHQIHPSSNPPFDAFCHNGWTILQSQSSHGENFERNWQEYKQGFGDLASGNFWLGLENMYYLTNARRYRLRVVLKTFTRLAYWIEYDHFWIESEDDGYRLHIEGLSRGNAGDGFRFRGYGNTRFHNGMKFSTKDRDNDKSRISCARKYRSGWWFNNCFNVNLNGPYVSPRKRRGRYAYCGESGCISWMPIHRMLSMSEVVMMIKPLETDYDHDYIVQRPVQRPTEYGPHWAGPGTGPGSSVPGNGRGVIGAGRGYGKGRGRNRGRGRGRDRVTPSSVPDFDGDYSYDDFEEENPRQRQH